MQKESPGRGGEMGKIKPERVEIKKILYERKEEQKDKQGKHIKISKHVSVDTEDIIAVFAGIIALIFAIAMVMGSIPINTLTVGVATLSGVGAVIAPIIKARNRSKKKN